MRRLQILTIILTFLTLNATSQILRYRVTANSGFLLKENGPAEIPPPTPWYTEYADASDFKSMVRLGADLEIMAPITSKIDAGVEFEYGNLSGKTQTAKLYNFFLFDWTNPLEGNIYPGEAIYYKTTQLNILGTFRYYLKPTTEEVNFFVKAFGGISFVGTDLDFWEPTFSVHLYNVGNLYSIGTKNSTEPKEKAFTGGLGFGGTYSITKRMAIYFEASGSYVNSDLINGVPNYDFTEAQIQFLRSEGVGALTGQVSLGFLYSAIPDTRINKRVSSTRSSRLTKKRTWKKPKHNKFYKKKKKR